MAIATMVTNMSGHWKTGQCKIKVRMTNKRHRYRVFRSLFAIFAIAFFETPKPNSEPG
jgi:hypothetical protein